MAMGDGVSGGGDGLPVTSASLRSDWDIGGATGNTANLVSCAPDPTSLYSAAIGAHQPCFGWTPPIRAHERGNGIESLDSVLERWRSS
jgi:hypothetical protein